MKGAIKMTEHMVNVLVAIIYVVLPIYNTIQLLKLKNMLSKN